MTEVGGGLNSNQKQLCVDFSVAKLITAMDDNGAQKSTR